MCTCYIIIYVCTIIEIEKKYIDMTNPRTLMKVTNNGCNDHTRRLNASEPLVILGSICGSCKPLLVAFLDVHGFVSLNSV